MIGFSAGTGSAGRFSFHVPTNVRFGAGRAEEVVSVLERNAWRRVGLIVDNGAADSSHVRKLRREVRESAELVEEELYDFGEPTYAVLESLKARFRGRGLEVVIGVGGGSAMDTAKGLAVLATNPGSALDYRGFDQMSEPVLPIMAVPTTAGTGSEITPNASFVDRNGMRKMGVNGEAVRPRYAFLDPKLTVSCPKGPTVSAGVDALVHATEAFVARSSTAPARLFAREGFRRVITSLPAAIEEPEDLAVRSEVMYGAFLAAAALAHSGTGPAAAMSYPLSVRFGAPHGIGGAVFLPHVARLNVKRGYDGYGGLVRGWRVDPEGEAREASSAFLQLLEGTWDALDVPADLEAFGVEDADLDLLVEETLELSAALEENPVEFGESELRRVFTRLIG